jgi:hypothetical protein
MNHRFLYCERHRFLYFQDYIEIFKDSLQTEIILVDNLDLVDYNSKDIYFVIGRLPKCAFFRSELKIIYINMEQLSKGNYLLYCQTISKFNIPIINYNEINQSLIPESTLLRYQIQELSSYRDEQMIEFNKESFFDDDKIYDVSFVGTMSTRRFEILKKLQDDGIKVHIVNKWGEQRDYQIIKSKILLNIHFEEDYKVYESLRCDRYLVNDVIIVSETSILEELLDIKDLLITADYNNLVSKVKDVLENYDQYIHDLKLKKKELLSSIIETRKQNIIQVENIISEI